jgi:hypothetical protein
MGHAKGKIEFFQYPKSLRTNPRLISEFKGLTMEFRAGKGGEKDAEFLQPLLLEFESWGKLPEHNPQFIFQRGCVVKKKGKGFSAILEAFDMGDESASFERKGKLLGCPSIPSLKDFFLR